MEEQQANLVLDDSQLTAQEQVIIATDVHKWYGQFHVLKGVSMTVHRGEVVVVMGPSGSGKSTFIRTFNALENSNKEKSSLMGLNCPMICVTLMQFGGKWGWCFSNSTCSHT
jgi:ABC-type polar amino acid transport system ATPase subunit